VKGLARCAIVAVTICAWLAISNHCAFQALAAKPQTAQSGCPFHSKPAKSKPQPSGLECCKILRAISNVPVKNLAPAIVDLPIVNLAFAELLVFETAKISFVVETIDTGPPGKTSFVELNASVRAHAPPVFV
jgi:hypothetical protein